MNQKTKPLTEIMNIAYKEIIKREIIIIQSVTIHIVSFIN